MQHNPILVGGSGLNRPNQQMHANWAQGKGKGTPEGTCRKCNINNLTQMKEQGKIQDAGGKEETRKRNIRKIYSKSTEKGGKENNYENHVQQKEKEKTATEATGICHPEKNAH